MQLEQVQGQGQFASRGGSGVDVGHAEPNGDRSAHGVTGSDFARPILFVPRTYLESPTMMIFRRALVRCDMVLLRRRRRRRRCRPRGLPKLLDVAQSGSTAWWWQKARVNTSS